ncbi:MAG: hypothetical protein S4CHLAM6_06570 [Chlamydiae bacterium]|nr:hypothetical protein [Chlamydiota bacterium]
MFCKYLKKSLSRSVPLLAIVFFCQGCGYRSTAYHNALSSYKTITVPYVEGDAEGQITSQVIQSLSQSGAWKYQTFDAELILKVKILGTKAEDVGYNRFFGSDNQVERWMVPNERLLSILSEVTVIDMKTQKVVLGPKKLSTSVKFDFDPEFNEDNLVGFSLAQYNFVENAQRSAHKPLNEDIAKTIVDYLINCW